MGQGVKTVIINGIRIAPDSPRAGRSECDLWGVTRCNTKYWNCKLDDWTAWFDLHPVHAMGSYAGIIARRPETWEWYKRQDGSRPIYLLEPHPEVPGSVGLPINDLQEWLKPYDSDRQFICQTGIMMAFAGFLGYKHVILNGVGVTDSAIHMHMHRDIMYWMGALRFYGVKVTVEGPSCYYPPEKIYGFETSRLEELDAIRREFSSRYAKKQRTRNNFSHIRQR